jgi:hypothetical protein
MNCEINPNNVAVHFISSELQGYERVVDLLRKSGILQEVNRKVTITWEVMLYSLIERYQSFRTYTEDGDSKFLRSAGTCQLTAWRCSLEDNIFIVTVVRISNVLP